MFNRYWRSYPWILQMVLLFSMIFTLVSFAAYIALVTVPRATGVPYTELSHITALSPARTLRASLIVQGIGHAGMFLLPAVVFAAFAHPRFREYLGLRLPGKAIHWLLTTGTMVGLIPILIWGTDWTMAHMHFGKTADQLQQTNNQTIGAYMTLNTPSDLLLLLVVLALLPALGEELLFRGVLLRMFHSRARKAASIIASGGKTYPQDAERSMVFPVVMTSLLFAAIHMSAYGFLAIFIAGCVLALIYFLTSSILCSMWAHLIYNGSQVLLEYFSHSNKALAQVVSGPGGIPVQYVLGGLLLVGVSFYGLVRTQTPMSADWSDNFRDEAAGGVELKG